VGDLLDLGFEADHVRGQVAGIAAAACSASSSSRQAASTGALSWLSIWLVMVTDCPGGAQLEEPGVPSGFGGLGEGLGAADLGGGGLLRRVRDQPAGVVGAAAWESRASGANRVRA